MQENSSFWVIFDTCNKRYYYKDLHNLLSYPRGHTLQYEYRQNWLSDEAVRYSANPSIAPIKVLLVYAQWNRYQRNEENIDLTNVPVEEMLWVPTRLAEMQLIPKPEGDKFYYHFKLLGYPKQDKDVLLKILSPMISSSNLPYRKWVNISDDMESFKAISRGKDSNNWQDLIELLGKPPYQFTGDTFWRLNGPYKGRRGSLVTPTYREEKQCPSNNIEVRGVSSIYEIGERESFYFEVISHTPQNSTTPKGVVERKVSVKCDDDGPVQVINGPEFDARSYVRETIELRSERADDLDERNSQIKILTIPEAKEGEWPVGAELTIQFRVFKKQWKVISSIILLLVSAVAIFIAGNIWEQNALLSGLLAIFGFLLILVKDVIISGKIPDKLV